MGQILTTNEVRDTYIRLLIDRFIQTASKIRKESIPQEINQDSLDYINDSNVVLGFITEFFNISKNEKDEVSSSSLFVDFKLKSGGTKMTAGTFKEKMTDIPGITFKKKKDGNYFCGIVEKS